MPPSACSPASPSARSHPGPLCSHATAFSGMPRAPGSVACLSPNYGKEGRQPPPIRHAPTNQCPSPPDPTSAPAPSPASIPARSRFPIPLPCPLRSLLQVPRQIPIRSVTLALFPPRSQSRNQPQTMHLPAPTPLQTPHRPRSQRLLASGPAPPQASVARPSSAPPALASPR